MWRLFLASAAVTALAACYPLQQAPLVYTSETRFGIGVTTPSTSSPNADVNIGLKTLDAAYIPVAVAKRCETENNATGCTSEIYKLVKISGANVVSRPPENANDFASASSKYSAAVAGYTKAAADLSSAQSTFTQHQNELTAFQNAQAAEATTNATLTSAQAAAAAAPADVTAAGALKNAQAGEASAQLLIVKTQAPVTADSVSVASLLAEQQHVDQLVAAADVAKSAQDDAWSDLTALFAKANKNNGQEDAYSVYGSFNGNAGGGAQSGASLAFGKTFATGVAAQHLTQGIEESAKKAAWPAAMANCLAIATSAASVTAGKVQTAVDACAAKPTAASGQ